MVRQAHHEVQEAGLTLSLSKGRPGQEPSELTARYEKLRAAIDASTPFPAKGHRLLDPLWRLFGLDSATYAAKERAEAISAAARAALQAELHAQGRTAEAKALETRR
jgi:hypothetical protein